MAVNWGLGQGNNALAMFQQGAQLGGQIRERREQAEHRNALLAQNQQQEERQQAEFAAQQEERAGKQQEATRTRLAQMAKLLAHGEKGPEQWQQARSAALQLFGPEALANVPEQYDANYAAQQRLIVEAMAKDGGQQMTARFRELKEAGYSDEEATAKMREFINRPDYMAIPAGGTLVNTRDPSAISSFGASQSPQTPPIAGGPQPGTVEDGYRFKGGDPGSRENWEKVNGGPTPQASGSFRP